MSVSEHEFLKHAYLLSPAPQKSFSTLMVSWKNANRNFPTERMHYEFQIVFRRKEYSFYCILKEKKRNKFITEITSFLNRPTKTGWTSPYKCKLDFFFFFAICRYVPFLKS